MIKVFNVILLENRWENNWLKNKKKRIQKSNSNVVSMLLLV